MSDPRTMAIELNARLDAPSRGLAAAAFAVLAAQWVLILSFVVPRLGTLDFLRLHYSAAHGVDWVDRWTNIFMYPGAGLAAFFANLAVAGFLGRRRKELARMVAAATLLVEIGLAAGGVTAILLNS